MKKSASSCPTPSRKRGKTPAKKCSGAGKNGKSSRTLADLVVGGKVLKFYTRDPGPKVVLRLKMYCSPAQASRIRKSPTLSLSFPKQDETESPTGLDTLEGLAKALGMRGSTSG